MSACLVAGSGGFIGGHLVRRLLDEGHYVRAVDIKPRNEWWQWHGEGMELETHSGIDLRLKDNCMGLCFGIDHVYNLACDMGGMGFIENNKAACMLSVLINTHLLQAAKIHNVKRYFYSSSACVYAADKQNQLNMPALKESDAYPAMPEDGYGWEKLFSERMCRHFTEDYGLETRVARLHNVYGPHGSWRGGREKAPAAICRKVIKATNGYCTCIDVWGNGTQQRSFMWIDDCIDGIRKLMDSDVTEPINIGSSEMVSIDQLIDEVENIAENKLDRHYDTSEPQGVRGRSSDNTMILDRLGWEPTTPLSVGLEKTYRWIESEVNNV